jgi:hypothetical protein
MAGSEGEALWHAVVDLSQRSVPGRGYRACMGIAAGSGGVQVRIQRRIRYGYKLGARCFTAMHVKNGNMNNRCGGVKKLAPSKTTRVRYIDKFRSYS